MDPVMILFLAALQRLLLSEPMAYLARSQRWAASVRAHLRLVEDYPHLFQPWPRSMVTIDAYDGVAPYENHEDRPAAQLAWLRRVAKVLRAEGLTLDKEAGSDEYYFGFTMERDGQSFRFRVDRETACSYVETDEVEEVEVVEVPAEVSQQYVRTELRPVMKRVCARLTDDQLEGVL